MHRLGEPSCEPPFPHFLEAQYSLPFVELCSQTTHPSARPAAYEFAERLDCEIHTDVSSVGNFRKSSAPSVSALGSQVHYENTSS